MKKKPFTIILMLVLIFTLTLGLTACGKPDDAGDKKEVTAINVTKIDDMLIGTTKDISTGFINIVPFDATDKSYTITVTEGKDIVSFNNNVISALKQGTAKLTVTATNGVKTDFNVKVYAVVDSISCELKVDKGVLEFNEEGLDPTKDNTIKKETELQISGVDAGYYVIVRTKNPLLDNEFTQNDIGKKVSLKSTIMPQEAASTKISYESSDSSIATVDENGVVTFLYPSSKDKEKQVRIIATAGEKSYTILFQVCNYDSERLAIKNTVIVNNDGGEEKIKNGELNIDWPSITLNLVKPLNKSFTNMNDFFTSGTSFRVAPQTHSLIDYKPNEKARIVIKLIYEDAVNPDNTKEYIYVPKQEGSNKNNPDIVIDFADINKDTGKPYLVFGNSTKVEVTVINTETNQMSISEFKVTYG